MERTLSEMGDSAPLHEKARAEQLVADVRAALKDHAATDRLRTLSSDLEQMVHSLGAAASQTASAGSGGYNRRSSDASDDVVDADYAEKP